MASTTLGWQPEAHFAELEGIMPIRNVADLRMPCPRRVLP